MSLQKFPHNDAYKGQLVIISNRGAYTFEDTPTGIKGKPSIGGLVSALDPIIKQEGGTWIAWGGRYSDNEDAVGIKTALPEADSKYTFQEVLLTSEDVNLYYEGFSNSCLWPLCHSFIEKSIFNTKDWEIYKKVNQKYAQIALKVSKPNDFIWIHDYHLALVPKFIRKQRSSAHQAFFWHIPFPSVDIFMTMPWAAEILKGLLNCESIAFHTESYVRNFLSCAEVIAGAIVNYQNNTIRWRGRKIKVAAIPIGIDCKYFEEMAKRPEIQEKAQQIRNDINGKYIVLGIDRLDYTKGIIKRLEAIECLLENYPEFRSKFTFIQIAAPSRTDVPAYQQLKRQVEETVGRINGKFTENYHVPIRYLFKPLSKEDVTAHFLAADMLLVTPLRDGLNLVAKEYVVAKLNKKGVLILSPLAGASEQLHQALLANPYDIKDTADQIAAGLKLADSEKIRLMNSLYTTLKQQDLHWWWKEIKRHCFIHYQPGEVISSFNVNQGSMECYFNKNLNL